jgi:hypothetical protein
VQQHQPVGNALLPPMMNGGESSRITTFAEDENKTSEIRGQLRRTELNAATAVGEKNKSFAQSTYGAKGPVRRLRFCCPHCGSYTEHEIATRNRI